MNNTTSSEVHFSATEANPETSPKESAASGDADGSEADKDASAAGIPDGSLPHADGSEVDKEQPAPDNPDILASRLNLAASAETDKSKSHKEPPASENLDESVTQLEPAAVKNGDGTQANDEPSAQEVTNAPPKQGQSTSAASLMNEGKGGPGVDEQHDKRTGKMTTKGLEYKIDVKQKSYKRSISKWHSVASHVKGEMGQTDVVTLKTFRDDLERELAYVSADFHELIQLLSHGQQTAVVQDFSKIESSNHELLIKLTDRIREIESDAAKSVSGKSCLSAKSRCSARSRNSAKSHRSSISSRSGGSSVLSGKSSMSIKRAEAAANAAALKAKLAHLDVLTQHRACLERAEIMAEMAMDNAKVEAYDLAFPDNTSTKETRERGHVPMNVNAREFIPKATPLGQHLPLQWSHNPAPQTVNAHSNLPSHNPAPHTVSAHSNLPSHNPAPHTVSAHSNLPSHNPAPHTVNAHSSLPSHNTAPQTVNARSNLPSHNIVPQTMTGHSHLAAHEPVIQSMVTQDHLEFLTRAMMEQATISRYPVPEPTVFAGDPIYYSGWKSSVDILLDRKSIPEDEKIFYLKRYLAGDARAAVEGYFLQPTSESYKLAREFLEERYGDQFTIANAFRDRLEKWPKLSGKDQVGLRKFSDFLRQCSLAIPTNPSLQILNDDRENRKLLGKLPEFLINRWARIVSEWREEKISFPPFWRFAEFIKKEAKIANDPVLGGHSKEESTKGNLRTEPKQKVTVRGLKTDTKSLTPPGQSQTQSSSSPIQSSSKDNACKTCNAKDHAIPACPKFLALTLEDRRATVSSLRLCFGCLRGGHRSRDCRSRMTCNTCGKRHPTALHGAVKPTNNNDQAATTAGVSSSQDTPVPVHTGFGSSKDSQCSKSTLIIPVYIHHKDNPANELLIYAMLDSQSDTTWLLEDTCKKLGAKQSDCQLLLSTLSAQDELIESARVEGLVVRGMNYDEEVRLPTTYTRSIMPADKTHIPTPDMAKKWPHLTGIADQLNPAMDIEIGLLIGYNCPKAQAPREVIVHHEEGPYAQRTALGWGIVGIVGPSEIDGDDIGVSHHVIAKEVDPGHILKTCIVLRTKTTEWPLQNNIVLQPSPSCVLRILESDFIEQNSDQAYSQDDLKFLRIMDHNIRRDAAGQYELPLPFRHETKLPDNKPMAQKRLLQLQRKLQRDASFKKAYVKSMTDTISKGYAERVPEDDPTVKGEVWYVPHHGVRHPKKPEKLRVVFDCSATYSGQSLNDSLLQGPDLNNKLIGVLIRFRQENTAFTCDIEGMFHQFRVYPQHRNFLRFLWWDNGDLSREPSVYRMAVHLFGATSSPAVATLALRHMASEYAETYGNDVAGFLQRDFYVDDGLKSVPDVPTAIQLARDSQNLCAEGGLRLHKFSSNSSEVLKAIPPEDRAAKSKESLLDKEPDTERVLGIHWNVTADSLGFKIHLQERPPTRRGILSIVSQVYDPLGLAAPVILGGKQILQELCRDQLDWDAVIPEVIHPKWKQWKDNLTELDQLLVPRCYKPPGFDPINSVELHHFSDASLKGYGVCSYLRIINARDEICCSLVMAKSRVTPLKPTTVPRLELTAAVTAARMSQRLTQELEYENIEHHFWTDSKIVLAYLQNDASRYHIFVANRVQAIHDLTDKSQWQYVSTKENPADLASRGCDAKEFLKTDSWFRGPDFLWKSQLPTQEEIPSLQVEDPEVRKRALPTTVKSTQESSSVLQTLLRCSSWMKMKRIMALCTKFVQRLLSMIRKRDKPETEIQVTDLQEAEQSIIRMVQESSFAKEIADLRSNGTVDSKSTLRKIDPFIGDDGILRVGGRISRSSLPFDVKHPAVLPKGHPASEVILNHFHSHGAHQGRGTTVNELRAGGYWIIGASRAAARLISQCVVCRKTRAKFNFPKMADLPSDRMEPAPPFTHCGVDCFGPWYIKEGRKELKRYGIIFTCLASRAVHIETAVSMDSSSFINALRRFISLRGNIRSLRSDQGSNFIGAQNELKRALEEMNHDDVRRFLLSQQCDYILNAPAASHMGGVWERMIRSIRSILTGLLQRAGTQLDDESLRTLMCEVAALINSRPLTVDNLNDPTGLIPLSPNNLLTTKSSVIVPPPGVFQREDLYCRRRWRRIQHLAEEFWKRWQKEFLLNLQQRQRWQRPQRNFQEGDITLLKEDTLPRGQWRICRISETYPSDDGTVRSVRVTVGDPHLNQLGQRIRASSDLVRPVAKLVLLLEASEVPTESEE